jgi:pilus assembly protein CpaB
VLPLDPDLLRLIKPGDRIDILVSFDAVMGDNRKEMVTATILQNVLVLGVGTNLGQGLSGNQAKSKAAVEAADQAFSEKSALSIALNPNEAQYLALCLQQGKINVIVRGLGDVELHPMEIASFKRLIK